MQLKLKWNYPNSTWVQHRRILNVASIFFVLLFRLAVPDPDRLLCFELHLGRQKEWWREVIYGLSTGSWNDFLPHSLKLALGCTLSPVQGCGFQTPPVGLITEVWWLSYTWKGPGTLIWRECQGGKSRETLMKLLQTWRIKEKWTCLVPGTLCL